MFVFCFFFLREYTTFCYFLVYRQLLSGHMPLEERRDAHFPTIRDFCSQIGLKDKSGSAEGFFSDYPD